MHYTITGTIQEIVVSGSTFQESRMLVLFDGLIQFMVVFRTERGKG